MTNSSQPKSAGIIGLGIIGSRVAGHLRAKGFATSVWNRTAQSVEGWQKTPEAVARRARTIQIFVTDGTALKAVIDQIAPALTEEHIVINASTVSLAATQAAAQMVAETGAAFLDAPFTGSKGAATDGQLVYYVGGSAAVLKHARPVLEASSKAIIHVGAIGHATVLKLTTNMISASTLEILAEAMGIVAAHGIDLQHFAAAMDQNACSSDLTRLKLPSILAKDFSAHFSLKNMLKDARFAQELASQKGLEVPTHAIVTQRMAALVGQGRGEEDYSVLTENYLKS
jgi:3-hydroxyisobutyrate dehydrogenase-like beta-hydroxyacid dehydrogenase